MEPVDEYKESKNCDEDSEEKTHCAHSFADCPHCHRVKSILIAFHRVVSEGGVADTLVNDANSAVDLMNDYHHIILQHSVDDDVTQFDKCYDFMVNTDPAIICDVNDCEIVRRHF